MTSFRSEEAVTMGSLTPILFVTCILLAITFFILWTVKRYRPGLLTKAPSNIQIIETKVDARLGTLAIVSAFGQHHLLVVTKSGTALHTLPEPSSDTTQKENNT